MQTLKTMLHIDNESRYKTNNSELRSPLFVSFPPTASTENIPNSSDSSLINFSSTKEQNGQGAYVPHSLQLLTSKVASLPEKFGIHSPTITNDIGLPEISFKPFPPSEKNAQISKRFIGPLSRIFTGSNGTVRRTSMTSQTQSVEKNDSLHSISSPLEGFIISSHKNNDMTSGISSLNPTPNNSLRDKEAKKVDEHQSLTSILGMEKQDKQITQLGATTNIGSHNSLTHLRNTSTDELKKLANKPKALSLEEQNKLLLESLQDSVFELQDQSVAILAEIKKVSYIINGLTKKIKILQTVVENINSNNHQNNRHL